jgi:SAM-dependent methyltransferase
MATLARSDRETIQDEQYSFPYHYVARLDRGRFSFHEVVGWGHEYLSYLMRVAQVLGERPFESLLDVGCGDGRLLSILAGKFPDARLVGLDYSKRAIGLARAMVPQCRFVAGDVTSSGLFNEKFDCAACIETIEHIDPRLLPDFVSGIRQHLKAGATLVVTVPSANVPVQKKHYQHFTPQSLAATLEEAFEIEGIEFLNGRSAVLRGLRTLLTNRLYTITHPVPLTAFYNFYVRRYLLSDHRRCGRLLARCRAR